MIANTERDESNQSKSPRITLVVGVGSPHGEDQIGWSVANELMRRRLKNCQVRTASTPLNLLDWLEDCHELHLVDACQCDTHTESIYRWCWPSNEIQSSQWSGTHDFHLPGVLSLAKQLGQLPPHVVVWGIPFCGTDYQSSIKRWADRIQAEIEPVNN